VFATTGDADEFGRLGARVLGRPVDSVFRVPVGHLETLLDDTLKAALITDDREAACD